MVRIQTYDDETFDAGEARRATESAIRIAAADVIYQPYLVDEQGRWRGFADFLERLPGGTYEPVDTKLARSAKPAHVLPALLLRGAGGADPGRARRARPRRERPGERETFHVAELRRTTGGSAGGFLDAVADEPETYGWPCDLRDLRLRPLPRAAGGRRSPHARRRAATLARGDADRGGRPDPRGARELGSPTPRASTRSVPRRSRDQAAGLAPAPRAS